MIFISYSRQNKEFVNRLTKDLKKANFNIWVDTDNLTPGTPSWERAIREAIKNSSAIILVASPDALQSDYVQGELTIAKILNRPIYPIWASGENWIDCVPLDMMNYQYVDGRSNKYPSGREALQKTLDKFLDTSDGTFTVSLPTHETIKLNLAEFEDTLDMLNTIFIYYGIHIWFEEWTYGTHWVLANVNTKQLLMPFDWITLNNKSKLSYSSYEWAKVPLSKMDIEPNSLWAAWSLTSIPIGAFAVNSYQLAQKILSQYGNREISLLLDEKELTAGDISDIKWIQQNYSYTFLVGLSGYYAYPSRPTYRGRRRLFVEAKQEL